MSTNGPVTWTQPIFAKPISPIVANGQSIEAIVSDYSAGHRDTQGIFIETSGGQHAAHTLFESSSAPITIAARDIDIEVSQVFEDVRRHLDMAAARARAGTLKLWLDLPYRDLWEGDGTRTKFEMSRQTGYGSTGVSWSQRPARCWVGGTEQTMVTGTPTAGQCQLSQTTDSSSITLGAAPSSGVLVELSYYPLMIGSIELEEEQDDYNSGTLSVSFEEALPVKSYG